MDNIVEESLQAALAATEQAVEVTHQQVVEELRKHMGNIDYSSAVTFERMLAGAQRIAAPQLFVRQLLEEQADDLDTIRHFNLDGELKIAKKMPLEPEEISQAVDDPHNHLFEDTLNDLIGVVMDVDRALFETLREGLIGENARSVSKGDFKPESIAYMRSLITQKNLPVASSVFSSNLWSELLADHSFLCMIDPSHRRSDVMNGKLGTLFGQNLFSDAFRMPHTKVMRESEWWTFAAIELLGKYFSELSIIGVDETASHYVWKYRHRVSFSEIDRRAYSALKVVPKVTIHEPADPKLFEKERRVFHMDLSK